MCFISPGYCNFINYGLKSSSNKKANVVSRLENDEGRRFTVEIFGHNPICISANKASI